MNYIRPKQITPERILETDRFLAEEATIKNSPLIDLILTKLERIDKDALSICDIGGATGILLQEIARRSTRKVNGSVLDVIDSYKTRLVDPDINFIPVSILDSGLSDNQFDIVTFRHLLHHLVSDTIEQSLDLQQHALSEMIRITRHGGYVIFEEEINQVQIFSRLVYYLSKIANRYAIRCKFFQAGISVVSFMTSTEIIAAINRINQQQPLDIINSSYHPWSMSLRWKLTLLMSRVGSFFLVIHKG